MNSTTDIANLALSEIGAKRINALDTDSSEEARACRLHFPQCRDILLRGHQWNFAQRRADLSRDATDPISGWESAWTRPADDVRFIEIPTEDPDRPWRRFALEGRKLLVTGLDAVTILYVSNAVPVNEWDPLFVDALVLQLAAKLAGPIANDANKAADCLNRYKLLSLPAAVTADAREVRSGENMTPRQMAARSGLVNARFGSTRSPY